MKPKRVQTRITEYNFQIRLSGWIILLDEFNVLEQLLISGLRQTNVKG